MWHLPVATMWLRGPLLAVAAVVLIYAAAGLLVSATIWRNILAQALGVTGAQRAAVLALSVLALALMAGLSLGLFHAIGQGVGPEGVL